MNQWGRDVPPHLTVIRSIIPHELLFFTFDYRTVHSSLSAASLPEWLHHGRRLGAAGPALVATIACETPGWRVEG
jgi:hypothetical protein